MMLYEQLLAELEADADKKYNEFNSVLLNNPHLCTIGVRVPVMRTIAKKYYAHIDELLTFPDEYYEVTFIKLVAAAMLPYEKFTAVVDRCVALIDNWSTCDSFKARCIEGHKDDFLSYIKKYIADGGEFYQRYAYVTYLNFYIDEKYLGVIFDSVKRADTSRYYVHMAVAWLIAEALVKYYGETVKFLQSGVLDKRTHNKAIQKARESFRITKEQKEFLKTLKR